MTLRYNICKNCNILNSFIANSKFIFPQVMFSFLHTVVFCVYNLMDSLTGRRSTERNCLANRYLGNLTKIDKSETEQCTKHKVLPSCNTGKTFPYLFHFLDLSIHFNAFLVFLSTFLANFRQTPFNILLVTLSILVEFDTLKNVKRIKLHQDKCFRIQPF